MVWIVTEEATMCCAHSGTPSDGLHAQAGVGVEAAQAAAGRAARSFNRIPVSRTTLGTCRKDNLMMSSDSLNNPDSRTRAAVEEQWRGSERGDTETEHAIATDAILDYPQSGERFRGCATILAQRPGHPSDRHFAVLRIIGSGNLWVTECVITYDNATTYSVSIMEFAHDQMVHETQYFGDTFHAPAWRAALAEQMPGKTQP